MPSLSSAVGAVCQITALETSSVVKSAGDLGKSTWIHETPCKKAKSWEALGVDLWVNCSLLSTL